MTKREVKNLGTQSIITQIFYMGVAMANRQPVKRLEKELILYCEELEVRGVITSGKLLYESMCK